MKKSLLLAPLLLMVAACSSSGNNLPLDTVSYVDTDRYMGRWFEIARIDHKFQRGCVDSEANYSMRDDGDVKVVNKCFDTRKEKLKQSTGRAWIKDNDTNAKLKVSFFLKNLKIGLFSGDYWVIDLDENYNYVVVGAPNRDYLWILSRTPTISDTLYAELLTKIEAMDFETSRLLKNVPRSM